MDQNSIRKVAKRVLCGNIVHVTLKIPICRVSIENHLFWEAWGSTGRNVNRNRYK